MKPWSTTCRVFVAKGPKQYSGISRIPVLARACCTTILAIGGKYLPKSFENFSHKRHVALNSSCSYDINRGSKGTMVCAKTNYSFIQLAWSTNVVAYKFRYKKEDAVCLIGGIIPWTAVDRHRGANSRAGRKVLSDQRSITFGSENLRRGLGADLTPVTGE